MKEELKKFAEIFVGFDSKPESTTPSTPNKENISFPNSDVKQSGFPTTSQVTSSSGVTAEQCEPHMGKIFDKYEQGFESLNVPGTDFFEFYKLVMQTDPNSKQAYDMALTMVKSMDSTLTKEKLIEQSQFYITELNKVHTSFSGEGTNKQNKILEDKQLELSSLGNDIITLERTIEEAKKSLEAKKLMVTNIDNKYETPLLEIKCKLQANDMAKDKLVKSIELVVNNLK